MEKFKKKFQEASNNKGITLVALVITIIVIIILAVVAISFAFGDNGLINRAEDAGEYYANDTAYTEESITNVESYINDILIGNGNVQNPNNPEIPKDWDLTEVNPEFSEDNKYVPVPKGFTASKATGEKSVIDGFVIYQGEEKVDDSNVEKARESKNQFVWIPVDNESLDEMYQLAEGIYLSQSTLGETQTITNVYSKLRIKSGDAYKAGMPGDANSGIEREPDILPNNTYGDAGTAIGKGIDQISNVLNVTGSTNAEILKNYAQSLVDEYTATYESVKKYGGFYIGRYELTGDMTTPTVQKNKKVLTADSAQAKNWYGLKQACSNVVNNDIVQTTMIYGNQWDEVMDWLIDTEEKNDSEINSDSSSWGNYNASLGQKSGFSDSWKANNIYDLAGNYLELTQEASATYRRVERGGGFNSSGSKGPVSQRISTYMYESYDIDSARVTLYIK